VLLKNTKILLHNDVILKDVPSFLIENKVVWGVTALMMNEMRGVVIGYWHGERIVLALQSTRHRLNSGKRNTK
jgi:hypothetical protein